MKLKLFSSILYLCATAATLASPLEFDFKDPKGVNNAIFKTDAPLESISGTATAISGKVVFDPANPGAVKGKIVVEAASMHLGNPMQQEHLHGKMWMNVAEHPQIIFEVVSTRNVKTTDNTTTAEVTGKLSIKGVAKELTVPVKLTYLPGKLKARTGRDGDLLVLRSTFTIKRGEFGINEGQMEDKVSNDIEISLSVAGAAPKG